MSIEDNMSLTNEEIEDIVSVIKPIIDTLVITNESKESLDLIDLKSTPISKSGSCEVIMNHLNDSFLYLNRKIDVPQGWVIEIGVVDENVTQGFVEVMWSLRCKGRGSFNTPHVIIKRQIDLYEILLPEKS